jgi:hypothetical protein
MRACDLSPTCMHPLPAPFDTPPDVVYCPLLDERAPHPAHGYCAGLAAEPQPAPSVPVEVCTCGTPRAPHPRGVKRCRR